MTWSESISPVQYFIKFNMNNPHDELHDYQMLRKDFI